MSDPEIRDVHRRGDDLLARIGELTAYVTIDPDNGLAGDGWRFLLKACSREIISLRSTLKAIAFRIERDELRRSNS